MSWKSVWDVLKWVLAALAAGFIGHFGRILAERIIHHRATSATSATGHSPEADLEKKKIKEQAKLEKKKLKAEIKKKKKEREE